MRRILKPIWITAFCVSIALFLGTQTGRFLAEWGKSKERKLSNEIILSRMKTLKIGDTLDDHLFERISGDSVWLKELFCEKSVIIVVIPSCEGCHDEINELQQALRNPYDSKFFIFVSWQDPRLLEEMQKEMDIESPFLYDQETAYFSQFDITTSPFNIIVNKDGVVLDMLAGKMLKDEFQEIIDYNRQTATSEN